MAPDFFRAMFPSTFLLTERWLRFAPAKFLPRDRGVDAMEFSLDLPAEDEFALAALSGASPYLAWSFPRTGEKYERFLTFDDADANDVERWKTALRTFVQKLSYLSGKPALLKSPPHTARIRRLLEAFPEARFVHLHRDPYAVYRSTMGLVEGGTASLRLQSLDRAAVHGGVVRRYRSMHDAYFRDRERIPPGRFFETSFAELEAHPIEVLKRLYSSLELEGFESVQPLFEAYLAGRAGYRRSPDAILDPRLRRELAEAWAPAFAAWGYPTGD